MPSEDPWAKYLAPPANAPSSSDDPYAKYLTKPGETTPDSGVGDTWSGYAGNLAYRAANTGTLGLADLGLAGVHAAERATGYDPNATDLTAIQKQGEEFGTKYPIASAIADLTGYGVGFGKLGLAARGARALEGLGVGTRLAQAGGTAGEAALADTLSHATRGELPSLGDIGTDVTVGGALGGLIGGRGRAVIPAVKRAAGEFSAAPDALSGARAAGSDILGAEARPPPPRSVADLQTAKDAAYQTLERTPVGSLSVGKAIARATSTLTPGEVAGLSGSLKAQIGDVANIVSNSPRLSLSDVDSFQRSIGAAVQPKTTDSIAAARIGEALRKLGGQPMADAHMAQARLADVSKLTTMDPSKAGEWAQKQIDNPRMLYDPYGRTAMKTLADLGPKPGAFEEMKRNIGAAMTDKFVTSLSGHVIGGALGHGFIGIPAGIVAGEGLRYAATQVKNAKAKRAMKAAIASMSQPGVLASPEDYRMAPWASQAARRAFLTERAQGED